MALTVGLVAPDGTFRRSREPIAARASGRTFTPPPSFERIERHFKMLAKEPGLGVLTADAGVGKPPVMRHLCAALPRPDYQVVYVCDTLTSPLDFYRQLATELGVTASHRRAQLWRDIKAAIVQLVDEQNVQPVVVVDEAQHLCERFLLDLSGFLNFAFDSRNLLVFWLLGQPALKRRLKLKLHSALDSRVAARVALEPLTDRDDFFAFLDKGLAAAGANGTLLSDPARELLFRASRGVPRRLAYLLRASMMLAHERDQSFVDDTIVEAALDDEDL